MITKILVSILTSILVFTKFIDKNFFEICIYYDIIFMYKNGG